MQTPNKKKSTRFVPQNGTFFLPPNKVRNSFQLHFICFLGVSITINNDIGPNKIVTSLTVMFRRSSIGVNITRLEDNEVLSVSVILPSSLRVSGIYI